MARAYTKDEVYEMLAEKNITKLEVHFSGGNDDGGVDYLTVTFNENGAIKTQDYCYNPHSGEAGDIEKLLDHEKLRYSVEAPIYWSGNYGRDFAGDFETQGVLTWDVENKEILINENYREGYDEDEDWDN